MRLRERRTSGFARYASTRTSALTNVIVVLTSLITLVAVAISLKFCDSDRDRPSVYNCISINYIRFEFIKFFYNIKIISMSYMYH